MGQRYRHKQSRTRKTARIVRVLAILLCVAAIADFSYYAFLSKGCFSADSDTSGNALPRVAVASDECRELIPLRDTHFRLDALGALLAVALLIGTGVVLSNLHRSTKRLLLGVEAAVLVLTLAYSVLWILAWH